MSTKKKLFLAIGFIILDIILVVTFISFRDATMLNNLKKEVNALSKLDVTKDRYNRKIVTTGDYAIVEKAIKSYLDDYAVLLQETFTVVNDTKLKSVLTYDNYSTDGPDFVNSLKYLNEGKNKFNENVDLLLLDLEEDTISNYINDKTDKQYFIDLYRTLMLNDDMKDSFEETKKLLTVSKNKMNNVYDTGIEVLTFLANNKDYWKLEDGEIKFLDVNLYNQYIELIGKLNVNAQ